MHNILANALSSPIRRRSGPLLSRLMRCIGIGLVLAQPAIEATTILKLDLDGLCNRAHRIFRGLVVEIKPGEVEAGGGRIPCVTYRIKVTEMIHGSAADAIDLTMVGNLKAEPAVGRAQRLALFKDVPQLEKGQQYLLFTTTPSKAGLSTTVGLGQGCFQIVPRDKKDHALNAFNNAGLGLANGGPVEYSALVQEIRKRKGQ
jgi:hypothetical protein